MVVMNEGTPVKRKIPIRGITCGFVLALAVLMIPLGSEAQSELGEYEVKAAFLLNFARLVEWPDTAFAGPRAPFTVGLLSSGASAEDLENFLDGKSAGTRKVTARQISSAAEAAGFHIVFVSSQHKNVADSVAKALRGSATLLVGESKDFVKNGGAIGFFSESNKIRFEIDPSVTEAAGLHVSSRLLRVARIFGERNQ